MEKSDKLEKNGKKEEMEGCEQLRSTGCYAMLSSDYNSRVTSAFENAVNWIRKNGEHDSVCWGFQNLSLAWLGCH